VAEKSPKLTAAKRRAMPKSQFALPGKDPDVPGAKGQYPIDTPGRARNALARVAQDGTPNEQAKVKAAVREKYPSIAVDGKKRTPRKGK
jgi:hypothetical protein